MKIDTNTKLFAVIGNPVEHSKSPLIHNIALFENNINGKYLAFEVENIENTIIAMREFKIKGYSVIIPHKINIINYLDKIDPLAKKIGAVNTVHNKNGKLIGYNTDMNGAIDALKEKTEIKSKKIYIVGAGGAARAIICGLCEEGAKITLFVRNKEKSKNIAKEFNLNLEELKNIDSEFDILINTTPIGMHPKINESPVDKSIFKSGQIVMDIIFNPFETKMLKDAKKNGAEIILGVEMFLNQAYEQFRIWNNNIEPPKEKMRKAVIKELKKGD